MKFFRNHLGKIYLLIILAIVYFFGLYLLNVVRPSIIEEQCSEIAGSSSNLIFKDVSSEYSFDRIRSECIDSTKINRK